MNDIKKVRLLIFDLDGTLADTIYTIRDGVNMVMEKYGFPKKSYDETRRIIGNGIRDLIYKAVPKEMTADAEFMEKAIADYSEFYKMTCTNCTECYDGMLDALITLKKRGYTIAVLSNKQDVFVKPMVEYLLPAGISSISMGQTEELPRKPDPTVPLMIAKELGFEPSQAAFIGDGETDVVTGLNSGMLAVGCSWGYRGAEILKEYGAEIIIDEPAELVELFGEF